MPAPVEPTPLPQRVRAPNRAKDRLDEPALAGAVARAARTDPGGQGDAALAELYDRQGFNGPAHPRTCRVCGPAPRRSCCTGESPAHQVRPGRNSPSGAGLVPTTPGAGWIANGTFATTDSGIANAYADPGGVLTMSVPRDRVADGESLLREQQEWLATPGREAYADLGRYCAARGVDAIGFNLAGENVVIILNRGIATVEEAAP